MSQFSVNDHYKAIVIGGSAGSFQVITKILGNLPSDFELPIIMALHRLRNVRHGFVEALNIKSKIEVAEPTDKETVKKGRVYLAPANYHLCLEIGNTFSMSTEDLYNNSRPSIDLTMQSAAYVYREKLIGILLSGANKDGALGMKNIVTKGGLAIIQDPTECLIDTMPTSVLKLTKVDHILRVDAIVEFLLELNKKIKTKAI